MNGISEVFLSNQQAEKSESEWSPADSPDFVSRSLKIWDKLNFLG